MQSPGLRISTGDDTRWVTRCRPFIFSWFSKNEVVTPKHKASHILPRPIICPCPVNGMDVPQNVTQTKKKERSHTMVTPLRTLVTEINLKRTISHHIMLKHIEPFTIAFVLNITCTLLVPTNGWWWKVIHYGSIRVMGWPIQIRHL